MSKISYIDTHIKLNISRHESFLYTSPRLKIKLDYKRNISIFSSHKWRWLPWQSQIRRKTIKNITKDRKEKKKYNFTQWNIYSLFYSCFIHLYISILKRFRLTTHIEKKCKSAWIFLYTSLRLKIKLYSKRKISISYHTNDNGYHGNRDKQLCHLKRKEKKQNQTLSQ